ncbi:MAG TPA: 4-(cytidine 5'-diphospho)-2-C-methyl-D-erythritol kinase [Bacteroidales bacterium]|nr:MAG: 4-(cytidine 5'-diphospho)-2-C-methyl-D-erythritol kinase [Bacteroidetes bacterium GWF2_33_38]OFY76343.1 MAG: 4-(cytidine 5'-diphospho)-2-C-methyl-D-erythritol kinase [Bacteroidetes bacterium RIFOXYA12_FULL_33_9]OFY89560.1 MAG: 4-(cytidine 5'-diphospho)-2-C-methyl-D-erythritol kinase [Bacteroidetes bacterium RIFOXYA2_FULL_33_7]HBF89296.1 4-(cytidine 5'-diphospho)-2-C-methyl-D-erythritol kinase [Bacteroidales bacterium]
MICFPNAKINIGLNIVEKRSDGFHNLETIFYPISLSDVLEFLPSNKPIQFINSGLYIDGNINNNLCVKAFNLLKKDYNIPEIDIHLHKIIPFGAGLGGGSSDAAFMLSSLNTFFELNLTKYELKNYASMLGSDCAFFIENEPCIAFEKGDKLEKIDLDLSNYIFAIVKPNIYVSTVEAYTNINPTRPQKSLKDLIKQDIKSWKFSIKNDFEENIFLLYPEIKAIKEKLYQLGAIYSSMSGSGSAVFGIFNKKENLEKYFPDSFIWQSK